MNCASFQPLLSAYLDRELSSDQQAQVELHIAACPACRALMQEMQQLEHQLRTELPATPDAVQQLIDSTLTTLKSESFPTRSRPWRTLAVAITSAAAGFLLAVALVPGLVEKPGAVKSISTTSSAENESAIVLALASGVVEREEQGTWKPLPTGAKLQAGEHIRTQPKSRCELRCVDGSEVRLNHESELIIHSPRHFQLKQGQVWSTVAAAATPFQIKTDASTVTALGTQFDLNCQNQQTTLTVLEGKTRFDLAGNTAEIKAGQQLVLNNHQGTFDIREPDYVLYQATNWVNEILVLKGRDNPEFNRRINDLMASIGETKMGYLAEDEIRTLGDHGVVPLCRYLQSARSHQDEARRELAGRIIADLAQPRSIADLMELLTDDNPHVRSSMAKGLARLTHQDMGLSEQQWLSADMQKCRQVQAQWKGWWIKNQFKYPEASR